MYFPAVVLSIILFITRTVAKGTSVNIYSRYNDTDEPPRSCIFDKIIVHSMSDVSVISHCEKIRGDVEVDDFQDAILRFDHLSKLEGSLIITNSENLMRVDAYSLRIITESFKMERLQSLGLIETPNLASIKTIEWRILPLLSQASLQNLKNVKSITIADTSLTAVSGFSAGTLYDLNINNNRFMEFIEFDVEKITNYLHITGNANNVQVKLGLLTEAHNMSVSNVRELNLTNLRKVEGSVSVMENSLPEITFPSLVVIGGSFRLADNNQVRRATFDSVLDIGGGVSIVDNAQLHQINFLSRLKSIGGALELIGDINETEWRSLKMVKGSISLRSTDKNFDCGKWINGPIKNTLRGGEIECFSQRSQTSSFTPSSGASPSLNVDHSSQSTKKQLCQWLIATIIIVAAMCF